MVEMFRILLLTAISLFTCAQSSTNISLGSSLSPNGNAFWLSDSGQFAFGFYRNGNGFGIGIWVEKMPQKTVVWTANRDDPPLPNDVTLFLSGDGNLILQQKQGEQKSIINTSLHAHAASMLNSGNFVLYDPNWNIIWQSFDSPTDTILPGQRLLENHKLLSGMSATNQTSGNFFLTMQGDGNLVLYPVDEPSPETAYWYTETSNAGKNVSLNFDPNGHLYLLNSTGLIIKNLFEPENISDSNYNNNIYRLTIEFDGILRVYSRSLDQNGGWLTEWESSWNKCDPTGLCGVNSYCTLMNQKHVCVCPPSFDYIDRSEPNLGCKRNYSIVDDCNNHGNEYSFEELNYISWQDNSFGVVTNSKRGCMDDCRRDCNCEVALYEDGNCKKLMLPLKYGRERNDKLSATLFKVGTGNPGTIIVRKKQLQMDILISCVSILILAFIVLAITGVLVYKYCVGEHKKDSTQGNDGLVEDVALRSYSYSELEKATNGFANQVGKGAFGTVYKGVLSNGSKVVAIKRLDQVVAESERDFRNEMKTIGRTHHKNLVKLLGYCHDGTNRLLVYEFMSNGSLSDFLFKSETKPFWEERICTALDIARGMLYLHEECDTQIIHCDIKPQNILMDDQKRAKLADFGLAKLLMPNQTRTYTGIRGTRGYVAPEWHKKLPITVKADVYSFGIVLLEIICCRKTVDTELPEDEIVLEDYVFDCFLGNELDKLVKDEDHVDKDKFERMVKVGLWCIQEDPSIRPTMKKVVLVLEGTVDIPAPPHPKSFFSSI